MRIIMSLYVLLLLIGVGEQIQAQNVFSYQEIDSLMLMHYTKGDFESAIPLMKQGMEKAKIEFGELDSIYANYYNNLGFFYQQIGEVKKSIGIYRKVIELRKAIYPENHPDIGVALSNLGTAYYHLGKYELAEPLYVESVAISKTTLGEKHPDYAQALSNLTTLYYRQKKYEKVEKLFLKILQIYEESLGKAHPVYAQALNNLAGFYLLQKQTKDAEKLYLEAIKIKKDTLGIEHPSYAVSLSNLGNMYQEIGAYERAEKMYDEAKQIWFNAFGESHANYANVLGKLAALHELKGDLDLAFKYALTSIAVNSENFEAVFPMMYTKNMETGERYPPKECNTNIESEMYLKLENLTYRNHLALNRSLQVLFKIVETKQTKSIAPEEKRNALKLLYILSKAAVKINDQLRIEFTNRAGNLRLLKDNYSFVKIGIAAALELNQPNTIAAAFEFAELNKSVLLMDAIKGSKARRFGDLPDSLVKQEIALETRKDLLKKTKYQATTAKVIQEVAIQENQLTSEIVAFLTSLKDKYPKYHNLKYENKNVTAKEVQRQLDDTTMLVEYFVGPDKTYQFLITKEELKLLPIEVTKKELAQKVKLLRKALSNYTFIVEEGKEAYELYLETAHWFYDQLLSKALNETDAKRLIIVTDGALGHLPFEVFLQKINNLEEENYKKLPYLLCDYTINYSPSATIWLENQKATSASNNHKILACAADYERTYRPDEQGVIDSNLLKIRTASTYEMRAALMPLPAVKEEVKRLEKIFDGMFLQDKATNELFFKEHAEEYGIIHLAMHGILNNEKPLLSSLAFTENFDEKEDNFLQAYEITQLHLNADLVILSACETGYGKFEQGEGIASLARSFMYAGVPSLVVSLWQVNDGSTAAIMQLFYENLATGMSKDRALRQAKLNYIEAVDGVLSHPAFWSPFIQLGDSSPIEMARRESPYKKWWIGIVGLLLLLLIGRKFRRE